MATSYINLALPIGAFILLMIMVIWTLIWTAIAMWKSSRNSQFVWYVILFVLLFIPWSWYLLGLIPILYLAFFQKNLNKAMPVVVQEIPKKAAAKKKPARKKAAKKRKK